MWFRSIVVAAAGSFLLPHSGHATAAPALPPGARLAFEETWKDGKIDPARWYALRKKWGKGNNGVVPENLAIARDLVNGNEQSVLVCTAHGDLYQGPVTGYEGAKTRVGGVLVSKQWFASGRFEVVMKIGAVGGAQEAMPPRGAVPAIWTYGHRAVRVPKDRKESFLQSTPLYNPLLNNSGLNEYWSEIDFPELGKNGDFRHGLYNTFCQNRYDWRTFAISNVTDGAYHTFTMEWRTALNPIDGITDAQVVESEGYWWIQDKNVPYDRYVGNPLKRLGPNRYSVYSGRITEHWLDGVKIGENVRHVPSMAAQLNVGIWLPEWGGPAPWVTASIAFASIKVWQYDDPGDVRGVLRDDISNNF